MYCRQCGNKIREGAKYCNKCGKVVDDLKCENINIFEEDEGKHKDKNVTETNGKRKLLPFVLGTVVIVGGLLVSGVFLLTHLFVETETNRTPDIICESTNSDNQDRNEGNFISETENEETNKDIYSSVEKILLNNPTLKNNGVNRKKPMVWSENQGGNGHAYICLDYADLNISENNNLSGREKYERIEKFCEEQLGGKIAVIESESENQILYDYVVYEQNLDTAFFGLSDNLEEGTWKTIDGEEPTYLNWNQEEGYDNDGTVINVQPNGSDKENYAAFYGKKNDGSWADYGLSNEKHYSHFLVEWNSIPEIEKLQNAYENSEESKGATASESDDTLYDEVIEDFKTTIVERKHHGKYCTIDEEWCYYCDWYYVKEDLDNDGSKELVIATADDINYLVHDVFTIENTKITKVDNSKYEKLDELRNKFEWSNLI